MSRFITIWYKGGEAKSIKVYFTIRKAQQIIDAINHGIILEAEITDKDCGKKGERK